MLKVNTIEFNGKKAGINSYINSDLLAQSMNDQRNRWEKAYPKATVKTEDMTDQETVELFANGNDCWTIGANSKVGE